MADSNSFELNVPIKLPENISPENIKIDVSIGPIINHNPWQESKKQIQEKSFLAECQNEPIFVNEQIPPTVQEAIEDRRYTRRSPIHISEETSLAIAYFNDLNLRENIAFLETDGQMNLHYRDDLQHVNQPIPEPHNWKEDGF